MTRTAVLFATVLALGACNKGPEVSAENASVEDVANQVAEARKGSDFVRPGKWSAKITFEEFNMPGAPAGTPAMLQKMNESTKATESCLTPEEAKRPKADFFAGDNKNCRYEHFNMGGGKIDLREAQIQDEAVLDIFTLMGGLEIQVPDGWIVEPRFTPILGGYQDRTNRVTVGTRRLVINGTAIMGGVTVFN